MKQQLIEILEGGENGMLRALFASKLPRRIRALYGLKRETKISMAVLAVDRYLEEIELARASGADAEGGVEEPSGSPER